MKNNPAPAQKQPPKKLRADTVSPPPPIDLVALNAHQQHLASLQKLIGKRLLRSPTTILINNMSSKQDSSKEEIKVPKGSKR